LESINGEVLGPTGPGGAEPLSSWSSISFPDFENYRIDLSGAEPAVITSAVIPEPASGIIWVVATAIVGRRLRRRR
jgi:hypothetical protein